MRKTKAGKILLGMTNLAFLAIMFTAVYSAIPPAYNLALSPATLTSTPSAQVVSVTYTVTNNGFYDIGNFYLSLSAHDPSNNLVNETHSIPVSIQRGSSQTGALNLNILQSYISGHHGNYNIVFTIHSEFAFGLIKFSVDSPNVVNL